jgi:zinc D-Ala-D-Ala carboxypeptidase
LDAAVPYSEPARSTTAPIRLAGLVAAIAAIAVLAYQSLAVLWPAASASSAGVVVLRSDHRGRLGEAGGAVPAGTSVFDDAVPGVSKLDPALLNALRRAATDAAADGVGLVVNGGWRSPAYEDRLRREAVARYGSEEEAARWVATGTTSAHVSGKAVDIGPAAATSWLAAHGAAYGLCRVYANEPWHYELRPGAVAHGCPSMYSDPTQDPRTHGE